jgi:ERF superfamily
MQNILKALILAKQEFKHIPKNSYNPYHKSKYANLDAVLAATSESFDKYNLCLLQPTEVRDERVILKTVIYHVESGEKISSELLLPQNTDYSTLFKQEKDSTLYQLNCNNAMFELVNIPNGSVAGNPPTTVNHYVFTNGRWMPLGNKTIQAAIQWASEQW